MSEDSEVRCYFKLTDICKWIGLTQFEILSNLVWFLVFTIYLTTKITLRDNAAMSQYPSLDNSTDSNNHHFQNNWSNNHDIDWFKLFIPLFCNDLLNSYFCIIVTIRLIHANKLRQSLHRLFWSAKFLMLNILFKYLLCLKLSNQTVLEYAEVFSPIFILFVIFCSKLCNIA